MKRINYSAINTAYKCPRLYQYQYVDKLPPDADSKDSGDLHFGTAVHAGLQALLEGDNGLEVFASYWESIRDKDLAYSRFKWTDLKVMGETFITRFERLHLKKFKNVTCEETIEVPFLDGLLYGTPDVRCDYDGVRSIVDFKTSGQPYDKDKIVTSEQFGIYKLLAQKKHDDIINQYVYYVFVKQPEPRIQVITYSPSTDEYVSMIENVSHVASELHLKEKHSQNRNGCIMGGRRCQYWSRCYGAGK